MRYTTTGRGSAQPSSAPLGISKGKEISRDLDGGYERTEVSDQRISGFDVAGIYLTPPYAVSGVVSQTFSERTRTASAAVHTTRERKWCGNCWAQANKFSDDTADDIWTHKRSGEHAAIVALNTEDIRTNIV